MDATIPYRAPGETMSAGMRLALALGLPVLGAVTVTGIYLGQEVIVAAAWAAMVTVGTILVQPLIGVLALTGGLLLAAYPTILQTLGFLSVGNLFGVCLAALLGVHVLGTRDLSFLKIRQVLLLAAIGVVLLLATLHADVAFPLLQHSRGKVRILDKTAFMMNNFFTRLGLLVFICAFVRTRRDLRALFLTFMCVLYVAVPSALVNWWQGELVRGFRAAASLTVGENANRLAMVCLIEIACWWFWAIAHPGKRRRVIAGVAIVSSVIVLFATGSRSGFLATLLLVFLLQSGPRGFRMPAPHLAGFVLLAIFSVMVLAPEAAWERMLRFSTEDPHAAGYTSIVKREDTLAVGWRMFRDNPLLGVGLGNFQEVSRQIYYDEYFRPPHNSYLWAAVEGGIFCLGGYLLLFVFTWRELNLLTRLVSRDPQIADVVAALRVIFPLFCFIAIFADLWLNPITYVVLGLVATMRRYLESLAVVPHPAAAPPRLALAAGS